MYMHVYGGTSLKRGKHTAIHHNDIVGFLRQISELIDDISRVKNPL